MVKVIWTDSAIQDLKEENVGKEGQMRTRLLVHLSFSFLLFLVIMAFYFVNDRAVIEQIFTVAGYTYGPLLGLFIFGMFTKRNVIDRYVPLICIASPIITYVVNLYSEQLFFGYKFSFELLIVNGLITFLGLLLVSYPHDQTK